MPTCASEQKLTACLYWASIYDNPPNKYKILAVSAGSLNDSLARWASLNISLAGWYNPCKKNDFTDN